MNKYKNVILTYEDIYDMLEWMSFFHPCVGYSEKLYREKELQKSDH